MLHVAFTGQWGSRPFVYYIISPRNYVTDLVKLLENCIKIYLHK